MSRPFIVGITGGIGSGKSTVCRIFEALGLPVYYADNQGKHLLSSDDQLKKAVISTFGEQSYSAKGQLNRDYLASIVFSDDAKLALLNSLVHPAVALDFESWVNNQSSGIVLKEAALLIENETYKQLDYLVTVIAPEKLRIDRVLMRDTQRSKTQVSDILNKQVSDLKRKEISNTLIQNDGKQMIVPQILRLHQNLQRLALEKEGKAI